MDRELRTVRVHIAGRWSADEMGQFLIDVRDLYNLGFVLALMRDDLGLLDRYYADLFPYADRLHRPLLWRQIMHFGIIGAPPVLPTINLEDPEALQSLLEPDELLEVQRIEFASPGFKDLLGLGEVIGHVKDFLLKLIDWKLTARQRQLENEERELKNQRLRIENAKEFVALGRDLGLPQQEIRKMVGFVGKRQDRTLKLIEAGKITSVSVPPQSGEDHE
jgi:hypothetical protein